MLIAFIAINAAACITGLCVHLALRRHLKDQHPLLWNQFRFPRSSPLTVADEEKAESLAQTELSEYLNSGTWRALGDARLERLVRARRLCFYVVGATMTITFIASLIQSH